MYDVPVAVKDALRSGMYKKNYRFVVLNDDGTADFTIDNDNLVSESVLVDERMCSGDTLKFGLCEGASLEFQYFGKPNITGRRVQVFVDVEYEGFEDVQEMKLNIVLNPDYRTAVFVFHDSEYYRLYGTDASLSYVHLYTSNTSENINFETQDDGSKVAVIGDLVNDYTGFYAVSTVANIKVMLQKMGRAWYSIPLGFFDVKNCSRQASTGIIKASCYNKLMSDYLDANANLAVLSQFDDKDFSLLVYDLKRLLLGQYEIEQAEIVDVTANHQASGYILDDATATKYSSNSLGGHKGPLGPCNTGYPPESVNTEVKFYYDTNIWEWDLDPTKYYRIDSIYDLDTFEKSFFDYVEEMILAVWFPSATEAQYMSNLVKYCTGSIPTATTRTWKEIFSIVLVKQDDTEEWYSIIGGQYGLSVAGTMSDLSKKTFTGYKKMRISTPWEMGYYTGGGTIASHKLVDFYGSDFQYAYWIDIDNNERGTDTWSSFKYPDGSIIPNALRPNYFMSVLEVESLSESEKIEVNISALPDYTLRDLVTASYETQCQFGQLSRVTDLFSGVELNHSRLLPADTLYPSDSLYPDGAAESAFRSQYSKLWADEGNVHKWRYLIITYKGLDENNQEAEFTLQRTVNADGTDDYNMSDNWLFKNLVWTEAQIIEYATAMVAKMQDITWFPFEMWAAGLPYLETGDEIEIPLNGESYTSYVLQRQLKGIQNLQDTYINGTLDIF